jgi:acid phosphatase (class A)
MAIIVHYHTEFYAGAINKAGAIGRGSMSGWRWAMLALAVPLASIALATPAPSADRAGYLVPGSFDILPILEPAPAKGDARYDADRRIFRATRGLLNTPRGALAVNDIQRAPDAMLADFACALGASLTPSQLPHTVAVIERASVDTNTQKDRAKDFYKRTRPLFIDRGPACQPRAKLAKTFDYPSGHTTGGWTWALILTDLAPDRATAILARGRAFGQSRAICGAHNASAVEAGFMTASATMTVVGTVPAYRADLEAAREEMQIALRNAPTPDAKRCRTETGLVAMRAY